MVQGRGDAAGFGQGLLLSERFPSGARLCRGSRREVAANALSGPGQQRACGVPGSQAGAQGGR